MSQPAQQQARRPGTTPPMNPQPEVIKPDYKPAGKLKGKVALITGGDSGIGRSVAVAYAAEGADVAIAYLNEHEDAKETKRLVEQQGRRCIALPGDIGSEDHCRNLVTQTVSELGQLNILVNNAAEQHPQPSIEEITEEQLERTFRTNIFSQFFLTKAALPHLKEHKENGGGVIINTASVTAYRGSEQLLDYSSTKGAIVAFTRSLAQAVIKEGVRVNAVAPGPIWTPLIPSTFPPEKTEKFGSDVPAGRAGQPSEVAPCYVFLASTDSTYLSGQVLHPNGGEIVNA